MRPDGTIVVRAGSILEPTSATVTVVASDSAGQSSLATIRVDVTGVSGYKLFVQGTGDADEVAGNDVAQGGLGDCWFLAVLSAVADESPQLIKAMIRDIGGGFYDVRFFGRSGPTGPLTPYWVRVYYNPQGGAGTFIGADISPEGEVEIWPRIVELAYMQAIGGAGKVGEGSPGDAWELITGRPAPVSQGNPFDSPEALKQALNEGKLIWIGTIDSQPLPGGLYPQHIYRIQDVDLDNPQHEVSLLNPHGRENATIDFDLLVLVIREWWVE